MRARNKWLMLGASAALALTLISWNWQSLIVWATLAQPRANPLPAFDAAKAQHLTAQRRAELEIELFRELWMWNTESRRYQMPNGLKEREQRWLAMAGEGYELAHLTLQVFEPGVGRTHNPLPALERLDELARQGDAGAMCLYGGIAFQLPIWAVDWTPQWKQSREWVEKGAALRHPQCLIALGGRFISGADGYPKQANRGSEMLFDAIRKGYIHGAKELWVNFVHQGLDKPINRRLEYCWSYHVAKNRFSEADLALKVHAHTDAPPEQRPALEDELNQFRQWHPSIEECIELTQKSLGR